MKLFVCSLGFLFLHYIAPTLGKVCPLQPLGIPTVSNCANDSDCPNDERCCDTGCNGAKACNPGCIPIEPRWCPYGNEVDENGCRMWGCAENPCELPYDQGHSNGGMDFSPGFWYYAPLTDTCAMFPYLGCGGNENRFPSKQDCLDKCQSNNKIFQCQAMSVCRKPPCLMWCYFGFDTDPESGCEICKCAVHPCDKDKDRGTGDGDFVMWYYKASLNECRRFHYSGAGGNNNRFHCKEECLQFCTAQDPLEWCDDTPQPTSPPFTGPIDDGTLTSPSPRTRFPGPGNVDNNA